MGWFSLPSGPIERPDHPAMLAPNWKTVLRIDLGLGLLALVGGLVIAVVWSLIPGAALGALGGTYCVLVRRRWTQWEALRREAGLDV